MKNKSPSPSFSPSNNATNVAIDNLLNWNYVIIIRELRRELNYE